MATYNIGLVGMGAISRYYVNAIEGNSKTKLVAVCDVRKPDEAKFPNIQTYDDYRQLVDQEDVQLVAIATPPNSHYEIIAYALSKGKKVIVEKPVATTLEDGKKCQALGGENNLYMAYHAAFAPSYLAAKKYINEETKAGDSIVQFFVVYKEDCLNYRDPNTTWVFNPEISGGGCLIDSGINAISLVEDLLGAIKPTWVEAKNAEGYKVETSAHVKFQSKSDSNVTGELVMDWRSKEQETRNVKLTFKSGTIIQFDFVTSRIDVTKNGKVESHSIDDVKEDVDIQATPMGMEYDNVLHDALNAFEGKSCSHLGLLPFETVMEVYSVLRQSSAK